MKMLLAVIFMVVPVCMYGQTEDEFLPEVRTLVIDSTEKAALNFCKEVMNVVPGYHFAFADREDLMMSKYFYDNEGYETVKFEFQFTTSEVVMPDSTVRKHRVVKFMSITAELNTITGIYNYIFNGSYTPDNIMAISVYDKAVSYKGVPINSSIVADDMKVGYWIISFFKL